MAHSPSPIGSDTTTESSCASEASFTWLPKNSMSAPLGNSLPDIRDVSSAECAYLHDFVEEQTTLATQQENGYVLESSRITSSTTSASSSSSATSSASEDNLHSEYARQGEGDCCSTPVLRRHIGAVFGSVPNELHQLVARRKRYKKHAQSTLAAAANNTNCSSGDEQDFFYDLPRRRSCSWSERRGERHKNNSSGVALGYMNASYQDLTQLDRIEFLAQQNSSMDRASNSSLNSQQSLLGRGNFLLDELSEIYDRNASILNDKALGEEDKLDTAPKVPPRQRKSSSNSNSSYSDLESLDSGAEAQHVTLNIRKAATPNRYKRKSGISNSLVLGDEQAAQDTSNFVEQVQAMRANYANSLEQCNFDEVKPLAAKRRFHKHQTNNNAQQHQLGSSTPNLSAYQQPVEELEDDIMVSSAHNSLQQLTQAATANKPLGILLPAGSRQSFGKEVSFCPVVSKYCWQEQSSEECSDQQKQGSEERDNKQLKQKNDDDDAEDEEEEEEEEEQEDETVIFNTKENERIAALFNEEQQKKQQQQQHQLQQQQEHLTAKRSQIMLITAVREINSAKTSHVNDSLPVSLTAMALPEQSATIPDSLQTKQVLEASVAKVSASNKSEKQAVIQKQPATNNNSNASARPLSIQLPILSEPPINRAHHILYASQQMLDNLQKRSEFYEAEERAAAANRSQSTLTIAQNQIVSRMPNTSNTMSDNNNEISSKSLKSSSKYKDEKHPSSKGFLSRFANNFRFSLRRKKKQQQQQDAQIVSYNDKPIDYDAKKLQQKNVKKKPSQADNVNGLQKHGSNRSANSSIASSNNSSSVATNVNSTAAVDEIDNSNVFKKIGAKNAANVKVTGKPPLPKQPPRVIQQQQQSQQHDNSASPHAHNKYHINTTTSSPLVNTSAGASKSTSNFLEAERSYYYDDFEQQLNTGMQANGRRDTLPDALMSHSPSPSRATVSQKTQMFNNLQRSAGAGQNAVPNYNKIGLIETNLDTHETVISGKTRSLVNIAGDGKHTRRGNAGIDIDIDTRAYANQVLDNNDLVNIHHDVDVDDDNDEIGRIIIAPDGSRVLIKSTFKKKDVNIANAGAGNGVAAQIASVRRPHKSMEFLLDKENQKNVLPPENELQKSHEHNPAALSEHQLRVQASLQRLNIPDWFRQYNQSTARSPEGGGAIGVGISGYKPGNFTRKRTTESGRWAGLNSKTTSLSSLGSQRSDRSPLLLSPSAHSHHGGQGTVHHHHQHHVPGGAINAASAAYGGNTATGGGHAQFSRWSTSHLNSSQTSPSVSQRGSFTRGGAINSSFMSVASGNSNVIRNSYRQPYLGWRSTEKLSQRTAHERLATSLLAQQQRTSPTSQQQQQEILGTPNGSHKLQSAVTPEIQSSIKEVTSAIVHYVNDQTNQQRSRSTSPNSRKCWLESSFVGIRPLDSPQTPIIETTTTTFATSGENTTNISNSNYSNNSTLHFLNNSSSGIATKLPARPHSAAGAANTDVVLIRMNGLSCVGGAGGGESSILI